MTALPLLYQLVACQEDLDAIKLCGNTTVNVYKIETCPGIERVYMTNVMLDHVKLIKRSYTVYDDITDNQIWNAWRKRRFVCLDLDWSNEINYRTRHLNYSNPEHAEKFEQIRKRYHTREIASIVDLIHRGKFDMTKPVTTIHIESPRTVWDMTDGNHRVRAFCYLKKDLPCNVTYYKATDRNSENTNKVASWKPRLNELLFY
jgi:hypothetical protein